MDRRSSTARPAVRGCWNCGSDGHRYSACPRPRKGAEFCFGCGRAGVTLRTCPRCRVDWEDLGPYHPGNGHFGRRAT
ncbi:Gag polyprotein [Cyphomyrmex costatus]|uniref:Gag polyprotein n=1 Tax=Cyphomyrmex costatus TaxID=456900 RepID=A0A151IEC2_9HYME|nr:Gag polyprotein [Cyphomyrmex costatus]